MSAHRKKSGAPEDAGAPETPEATAAGVTDAPAAADAAPPPAETAEYWREHCLRAMAEVQNLKRRAGQDVEERTLLRLEGLLADLLRVDDYFSAALDHVPAAVRSADGAAAFLAGVGAIRQALESVLLSHGAVFLAPAPARPSTRPSTKRSRCASRRASRPSGWNCSPAAAASVGASCGRPACGS
jgi:molecular chaperone GrpE (heat shock protein)